MNKKLTAQCIGMGSNKMIYKRKTKAVYTYNLCDTCEHNVGEIYCLQYERAYPTRKTYCKHYHKVEE